jgi:hypothetical protein
MGLAGRAFAPDDRAMGVLFDYFAAPSDERAGETIDIDGGPGQAGLAVEPIKGIDPVVQMGTLELARTARGEGHGLYCWVCV